jgi:hypothetical protein
MGIEKKTDLEKHFSKKNCESLFSCQKHNSQQTSRMTSASDFTMLTEVGAELFIDRLATSHPPTRQNTV